MTRLYDLFSLVIRNQVRLSGTRRKAFLGRRNWLGVSLGAVPGSAHQFSITCGGPGSLCATVCDQSAGWRDWRSPDTLLWTHAPASVSSCRAMRVSMHVGRFGEELQGKTLPGRLELPTLRLTASRYNQLSSGSNCNRSGT